MLSKIKLILAIVIVAMITTMLITIMSLRNKVNNLERENQLLILTIETEKETAEKQQRIIQEYQLLQKKKQEQQKKIELKNHSVDENKNIMQNFNSLLE